MRVLITGGHLSPALAVIDELKKNQNVDILYVGRKYSLEGEKVFSLEYYQIKKLGIKFQSLTAGRLTRVFSLKSIIGLLKIPIGFIQSFFIIRKFKPDVILSFGSYVGVPVTFWGYIFRIPIFTHEQTIKPGLANKIIGFFAKKIFLAFSETVKYFNNKKTLVIGNPVKKSIFKIKSKPFDILKNKPIIYITGGSLGSHSINVHVKKILSDLLKNYIVIHQTGDTKQYHDYEDLQAFKKKLPINYQKNYFLKKYFLEDELGYIYSLADLVISRAGANTFFELVALKKPAILIPLPWSAGREQQAHAMIFAKLGFGEIFHQIESSKKLLRLINKILKNISFYQKNYQLNSQFNKSNAAKVIVEKNFN